MEHRPLPLDGVTVIAVEQYGAGPFGTMLLADLGAEVIKIENPAEGGDVGRLVGPFFFAPGDSHFHQAFNRNKRSVGLDLKHPEGMRLLRELLRHADAMLDNLRGDLPERLGLTYEALKEVNPRLVCAHLSAYGRDGSRRSWPGYDYLMQAEAGYLSLTGEPDGPPARFGVSVVDMMTGLMAAFALVSGLVGARATGRGMDLDVSLFDTALHNLTYLAAWYLNGGHVQGREPRGAHPSLTPSQLYRTRDGWIFIMCNKEKFWPVLAERLGRPEWAADPRFATFRARLENRAALTGLLDAAFSERTTAEWLEAIGGAVPAAPVLDVGQALDNPFVRERGGVAEFARAEGGPPVRMLTGPVRVDGRLPPTRAAPALGADTEAVLRRLGLDGDAIADLRRRGAVR
ncbi:CoA transferase [Caldovatus sediminis]|jgi:crotonobetainyl-CoA:carnitine CoA-transferase CaiB-like acyl-CoA transferase|uniref:CoA transferase n=1 Tax=Caldovatus sediminis TaxID=2041189 RepID=A0A8J2ZDX1_9PROT|nr:CoA transferase [Caldovatus sediminis]GGG44816.1 CoA transferase [Caldovatus sediminis]